MSRNTYFTAHVYSAHIPGQLNLSAAAAFRTGTWDFLGSTQGCSDTRGASPYKNKGARHGFASSDLAIATIRARNKQEPQRGSCDIAQEPKTTQTYKPRSLTRFSLVAFAVLFSATCLSCLFRAQAAAWKFMVWKLALLCFASLRGTQPARAPIIVITIITFTIIDTFTIIITINIIIIIIVVIIIIIIDIIDISICARRPAAQAWRCASRTSRRRRS